MKRILLEKVEITDVCNVELVESYNNTELSNVLLRYESEISKRQSINDLASHSIVFRKQILLLILETI